MNLKDPNVIKKIPLFEQLSTEHIQEILNAPENGIEEFEPKDKILREEEIGTCMYVVLEGVVDVTIRGAGIIGREVTVATLRAGDFFGEQALLPEGTGRRNASVKALHPTTLFRIDKKYVLLHIKKELDNLDDSEQVTVVSHSEQVTEVTQPDDPSVRLMHTVMGMRLFQSLSREELLNIDKWTKTVTVGPGEFVIKEEQPANCLYVIIEGTVEVFTLDDDGKVVLLGRHEQGEYFGEQALLSDDGKRSAYVRTDGITKLAEIRKEYFRLILKRDDQLKSALEKKGEKQRAEIKNIQGS